MNTQNISSVMQNAQYQERFDVVPEDQARTAEQIITEQDAEREENITARYVP